MADGKQHQQVVPACSPEWRVTVNIPADNGPWLTAANITMAKQSTDGVHHSESASASRLKTAVASLASSAAATSKRVWKILADDPKKSAVHGLKLGLALTLVSLLYYVQPLYDGVGGNAIWAVMTVVLVFEGTVGGCMYKTLNRTVATACGGLLAVGVCWMASKFDRKTQPVILAASVFLVAFVVSSLRVITVVKTRFDYGITIIILTYSLVAVSGFRVSTLLAFAVQRVFTIVIANLIVVVVSTFICPMWAGEELHRLTVRNMENLANALEECVDDYFNSGITPGAGKLDGYKAVLAAKGAEDSNANLASWELAHGQFGFRHPWAKYQEIGAAMRRCAYCIELLRAASSIKSETYHQVPEHMKIQMKDVCVRVSRSCAAVLMEMSSSVQEMTRARCANLMLSDMNCAVQELLQIFSSLTTASAPGTYQSLAGLLLLQDHQENKQQQLASTGVPLLETTLPLITVVSLLVEISSRVQKVVDAVDVLANLAVFKPVGDKKPSDEDTGGADP